mgnify:CR=1 FL=1
MKLGDLVEKIFIYTGIKWLHKKIMFDWLGYTSCNCKERKEYLNNLTINRDAKKNDA